MKIAFLAEYLVQAWGNASGVSGGNRRLIEIANSLVEKGHEVDILIVLDDVPLECDWMEVKANIKHLDDREDYDVAIMIHAPVWVALEKVIAKHKVYYWLNMEASYFRQPTWYDAYQRDYFIIANSHWTAECAEMVYGKKPPVVHGGINKKLFYPVKGKKEFDIVAVAPPDKPEKGQFYINRVCEITGWTLNNIIEKPQEDMAGEYAKGEIYLGMPDSEGFYNPPLEAMACGIPVVLTNACGNMDYARDEENCLLIPRNVGAAMKAIYRLKKDKKLREKLIKNGFIEAAKYEWKDAGDEFEKVLLGL